MSTTRRIALCALPLLALSACGDPSDADPPAEVGGSAVVLPADLCAHVLPSAVERWELLETGHDTSNGVEESVATCEMSGIYDDQPVSLRIDFTTYGGSADEARQRVGEELAAQCEELEQQQAGRFDQDDNDCTARPPRSARPVPTQVVNVARAVPARGIVRVEMSHEGLGHQLVAPEVIGVSAALTRLGPDDLR